MNPRMSGIARGGPRLGPRRDHVEAIHVGVEAGQLGRREVEVVHAELAGLGQDAVVDVGDVADAPRVVAEVAQASLQDVVGQVGGGVAEVGRVVRGDPARVHRTRSDHSARRARSRLGRCRTDARWRRLRRDPAGPVTATGVRPVKRIATLDLYFMLTWSSTAANASIGAALDSSPASTARRSGIFDTMSIVVAVADGWSEHTSTSDSDRMVDVAQLLGGHVVHGRGARANGARRPAPKQPPIRGAGRAAGTRGRPWPGRWPSR